MLDVEKDVAGEGIGSFDILFAANVLHATSNMTNTLQHCKVSQCIRVIGIASICLCCWHAGARCHLK